MIIDRDLVFTRINPNSCPQWAVSIGGRQVAEVIERPVAVPRYRVGLSGLDQDKFLAERKDVVEYIINALSSGVV